MQAVGTRDGRILVPCDCLSTVHLSPGSRSSVPTANIQRRANWTQLIGAERGQREPVYRPRKCAVLVPDEVICIPLK